MVGGLVENQQIEGRQQQFGQRQTGFLAAGEHFDLLLGGLRVEQETAEDGTYLGTDVAHGYIVNSLKHSLFGIQQFGLVLGVVANNHLIAQVEGTALGCQLSHYGFHHRGLALAIAPHKGHTLAALQVEVHFV